MAIGSTPHCPALGNLRRLAAEPGQWEPDETMIRVRWRRSSWPLSVWERRRPRSCSACRIGCGGARPRCALCSRVSLMRRWPRAVTGRSCSPTRTPSRCSATNTTRCSGQPVQVLWPERLRERYTRNMELYFATDHPLRFTTRADGLRSDGSEFVGEMSWGIVETEAGPLLLAIGRDMTAHREALAKVQRQSRQVAAVAALGERALAGADVGDLATEAVERMRETLPLVRAVVARDGETLASFGSPNGSGLKVEIRTGEEVFGELCVVVEGEVNADQENFLRGVANVLAVALGRLRERGADALGGAARSPDRVGQPGAVPRAADPRAGAHGARRGLGLRAVHRPRRLQGGQRPVRARGGRRAADRLVAAAGADGAPRRHGGAARRRRVRGRVRGHRRAHRDPARHAPDGGDPRAAGDRRRRAPAVGVDRDRAGQRGAP